MLVSHASFVVYHGGVIIRPRFVDTYSTPLVVTQTVGCLPFGMDAFNAFSLWWPHDKALLFTEAGILLFAVCFIFTFALISELDFYKLRPSFHVPVQANASLKFIYVNFIKPHERSGLKGQQGALESFYRAQVLFICICHDFLTDALQGLYLRCYALQASSRP